MSLPASPATLAAYVASLADRGRKYSTIRRRVAAISYAHRLKGASPPDILLLGFAAALRRSEIVALDVADLEFVDEGVIVHLRRSKTDQEGEGQFVPVPHGSRLKPVAALRAWLEASAIADGAVFRPIGKGGRLGAGRLTDRSVASIVKHYAAIAKLDVATFSGHSLRAGFVTQALEDGADPFRVMDITRHVEVWTLRAYDRRAKAFKNHAGKKFL